MAKKRRSRAKKPPGKQARVRLETHEQLVAQLPEIFRKFNASPEIGRLTLINPILALEDIGFELSEELQEHLRRTLPFPRGRVKQIQKARKHLIEQLRPYTEPGKKVRVPKTPRDRARLLFEKLELTPEAEDRDALTVTRLRRYRERHPVAAALYEHGRLERGTIIFMPKAAYASHKAGQPHHPWLKRLHFHVGE